MRRGRSRNLGSARKLSHASPGMREHIRAELREVRNNLGYEQADEVERMLIAALVLCYLRVQHVEAQLINVVDKGATCAAIDFYERQAYSAHKRLQRAATALERVRALRRRL